MDCNSGFLLKNFCLGVYYHFGNFHPLVQIHLQGVSLYLMVQKLNSFLQKLIFQDISRNDLVECHLFLMLVLLIAWPYFKCSPCACFILLSSESLAYEISYILSIISVLLKYLCVTTHMLFYLQLFLVLK